MITLSLKDSGAFLGTVEESDLQMLVDLLEEEHSKDTDYYISPETIAYLEAQGASAALVRLLKQAVGVSDGVEIVWTKD